jgi:hypothetical protein
MNIEITHKGTQYRASRVTLPGDMIGFGAGRVVSDRLMVAGVQRLVAGYTKIIRRQIGGRYQATFGPRWHAVRKPSLHVQIAFSKAERDRRALFAAITGG